MPEVIVVHADPVIELDRKWLTLPPSGYVKYIIWVQAASAYRPNMSEYMFEDDFDPAVYIANRPPNKLKHVFNCVPKLLITFVHALSWYVVCCR
jgi:hypothetical protein